MHTDEPREVQGVELGYDPRDINLPVIKKIVVWFFVLTVLFFGGGAIVYIARHWGGRTTFDTRKAPIAGPKIQGNITAKVDIMDMRQAERAQMETYGTNPDGKQRIPVDRALDLLAERGLPLVTSDKTAQSKGNTIEQNATGPASPSTTTTPGETGPVPTPDQGGGATGTTAGGSGAATTTGGANMGGTSSGNMGGNSGP